MTLLDERPAVAGPLEHATPVTMPAPRAAPRTARAVAAPRRLASLDAIRGLAIALMLFVNNTGDKAATPRQLLHAPWNGFTVADLVFPLFLFALGLAMPFSRRAGEPRAALRRVGLLVVIGSLLVSAKYRHLAPSTGVLQHIAGAYLVAWAVLRLPRRLQPAAAAALFGGLLLAAAAFGGYTEGSSFGERFDQALIGVFSHEGPHVFLPSALSVLGGVWVGRILKDPRRGWVLRRMGLLGVASLGAGLLLSPVVPLNKALWTPSYVLVAHGLACLVMAGSYYLFDRRRMRRLARPLVVLGANAITAYAVSYLVFSALLRFQSWRVVRPLQELTGPTAGALLYAAVSLVLVYAVAEWMWRRRLFVKV